MNREATLKKAEQLLRDGKLDPAIEEYLRLIQQHPRDWGAINALGDLYVRAGRPEQAIAQFTRVADSLFEEGFLPKAQALYKKALKVQSGHPHTLRRLAEIATKQGLLADARQYRRQLGETDPVDPRAAGGDLPVQPPAAIPPPESVARASAAAEPDAQAEVAPADATHPGRHDPAPEMPAPVDEPPRDGAAHGVLEIDLSDALRELESEDAESPGPVPGAATAAARPPSLQAVFTEMRTVATFEQQEMTATAHYELASRHLEASRWEEAIAELRMAARAPALRFEAGSQLGRLLLSRGLIQEGIDWLERAVETPGSRTESRAAVMYDLAGALEQIDESARALAILMEIEADVPRFRDVGIRVTRLKRLVAGQ